MTLPEQFTSCDLHIPYKKWADEPQEEENYNSIERWALNFRKNCLPKSGATWPPASRFMFSGNVSNNPLDPSDTTLIPDGSWRTIVWADHRYAIYSFGSDLTTEAPGEGSVNLAVTKPGILMWNGWVQFDYTGSGATFVLGDQNGVQVYGGSEAETRDQHQACSTYQTIGVGGSGYAMLHPGFAGGGLPSIAVAVMSINHSAANTVRQYVNFSMTLQPFPE